jgi:hypothetical protein
MTTRHPEISVKIDVAANDFRIIDHVAKALRKAGVPAEEIDRFCDEVMSGDTADMRAVGHLGAGRFQILKATGVRSPNF